MAVLLWCTEAAVTREYFHYVSAAARRFKVKWCVCRSSSYSWIRNHWAYLSFGVDTLKKKKKNTRCLQRQKSPDGLLTIATQVKILNTSHNGASFCFQTAFEVERIKLAAQHSLSANKVHKQATTCVNMTLVHDAFIYAVSLNVEVKNTKDANDLCYKPHFQNR